MDAVDRQILNLINKGLPLTDRPFLSTAESVGIGEQEVVERIRRLSSSGVIRRIGATIDPHRIGWHSTLCAAEVPHARVDEFAALVGGYDEVTHNYLREGHPNCWFTVIAPSEDRLHRIISEIGRKLGIEIENLPARKIFKIRVAFDIS
ncbi:MAG TPA: AsnC family transcriptional regulator [Deltaproteobacteria bacterium]|nr:AsnC family transcriptional regulator [Deltaproteobacteria bacterium]